MAYLREGEQAVEIDFTVEAIWAAIPKAVEKLEWTIESKDDYTHHFEIKTKGAFLSYHSILQVDLTAIDEKTSKMTIKGETPVTTITAMADYGRTNERIDLFVITLANIMTPEPVPKGKTKKSR
jgi:hypothetical protein